MASKSQHTKRVRRRKDRPNKANLKADQKRIQQNAEILRKLADEES